MLADWAARLGQDLFNPPNVGGWPGDEAGFRPASLIGRTNFAAALVEGRGVGREIPFDPIALARRYRRGSRSTRNHFILWGTVAGIRTRSALDRAPCLKNSLERGIGAARDRAAHGLAGGTGLLKARSVSHHEDWRRNDYAT